jgi:HSP20 family protein
MPTESENEGPLTSSAERLRRELDRWLDVVRSGGERALDAIGIRSSSACWEPRADVVETEEQVFVDVDVPGVTPDDVELSIAGNMLTVKGERTKPQHAEEQTTHRHECAAGAFRRSIPLPASVNPDDIHAEVRSGVLYVTIGKTERAIPRHVQISTAAEPSGQNPPTP